ncbi:hypothetical protein N7532_004815 [Penicillium argentinense]|uniref:LysM domain-containing protein n=1 Tax=Penicillium argentinense TaxID=1131581 RepID=A0A9W9K986_9EURO|nr:uncharacterized protein N7532_004815 [Penicillium argentinense]KAJ5097814.1 hypothetical protein N7532_004815 [Penicillium argentinense]
MEPIADSAGNEWRHNTPGSWAVSKATRDISDEILLLARILVKILVKKLSQVPFAKHFTQLLLAGVVPAIASARALSRRAVDCSFTTNPSTGDTCESFARSWCLTVDNLKALNPGLACPNIGTTKWYCVIEPTNEPAMPGIVDNCDGFYKVSSGDQCDTIAADHGISKAQFLEWNTELNERKPISSSRPKIPPPLASQRSNIPLLQHIECSNFWLDYYVCVHVPGATTGPQPQMPGIIST